jgi:DNA primase
LSCKVVLIPDTEDIDSLLRSQGKDAFEALRRAAPDGLAFCLSVLRGMAPKDAVEWARSFLSRLELPELLHRFASELSAGLGLEESELRGGPQAGRKPRGHGAPPPEPAARRILPEREIMTFAVRYPHRLSALRDCGADLMLTSPWAHALWDKLERFSAEEIFTGLNEQEKKFWLRCRDAVTDAPALDGETREWNAVRQMLDRWQKTAHSASVAAALRRGTADYDTEKEYLCALNAARGRRSDPE